MNILDLLREKSIEPRRVSNNKGGEYHSPCPGCGGDNRFHVWSEQNNGRGSWWCRGCGKGGDGIQFLREFSGMSFKDACSRLGIKKTTGGNYHRPWKAAPVPPRQLAKKVLEPRPDGSVLAPWQQQAEKLLQSAEAHLQEDPAALDHLQKTRGITPETARRFRLGLLFFPGGRNCRFSSRKKWGVPPKDKGKKPDALWIPRGLLIPGFNAAGELVRLRIRRPDTDHQAGGPKYYILPGSGADPYLIYDKQLAVVVVESELDAFLLVQEVGDLVGVLAMGSSAPRPTAAIHEILSRGNLILLAFDADEAGQKAAERWRRWYDHAYSCLVPGGCKDPGEAWQAGENLRAWIKKELPSAWLDDRQVVAGVDESPAAVEDPRLMVAGVPVLAVMPGHDGKDFYLVQSVKEKLDLSRVGKAAFLPDEVRQVGKMPHELFRAFLDFNRVFPGSVLVNFLNGGKKHAAI